MPIKVDDAARAAMLKAQAEAREAARRAELARQRAAQKAAQAAAQKAAQAAAKALKPDVSRVKRDLTAPKNLDLVSAIKRDFSQSGVQAKTDGIYDRRGFEATTRQLGFGLFADAKTGGYSERDYVALKDYARTGGADEPGIGTVKDSSGKDVPLQYRLAEGKLFADAVDPTDVAQGATGDCWFLATVSSMAKENPDAIKNMVRDNGDGTYTVTFHEPPLFDQLKGGGTVTAGFGGLAASVASALHILPQGKTVEVTVDGDLPSYKAYGSIAYGEDKQNNELWVPIMEKAYAKAWGDYNRIGGGGNPAAAMYMLTGKSVSQHGLGLLANPDKVFADLKTASANGELMVAGTSNLPWDKPLEGIEKGHAYTVLGVSERNGEKYVQLRNPWGFEEPANNGANDGVFEITAKQFCENYAYYNRGRTT